jgi:UPF0716 protein FxsA
MTRFVPALVVVLPLAELYSLLAVGARIGAARTFLLLLLAAGAGVAVMRHYGTLGLPRLHRALASGQPPAQPMLELLLAQLAGVLLIVPGFIGDAVALCLLVPPLRRRLAARLAGPPADGHVEVHVIEGEFRRRDEP